MASCSFLTTRRSTPRRSRDATRCSVAAIPSKPARLPSILDARSRPPRRGCCRHGWHGKPLSARAVARAQRPAARRHISKRLHLRQRAGAHRQAGRCAAQRAALRRRPPPLWRRPARRRPLRAFRLPRRRAD
eukprot:4529789-Prymnesium_polylepis.1